VLIDSLETCERGEVKRDLYEISKCRHMQTYAMADKLDVRH
jgi:hypothetical protein